MVPTCSNILPGNFPQSSMDQHIHPEQNPQGLVNLSVPCSWMSWGFDHKFQDLSSICQGLGLMSLFGDFEYHLEISVGDYIPNGWVMFNWDIYQPLSVGDETSVFFPVGTAPCQSIARRTWLLAWNPQVFSRTDPIIFLGGWATHLWLTFFLQYG